MTDPKTIMREANRQVKIAMYSDLVKMYEAGAFYAVHFQNYLKSDQYMKDYEGDKEKSMPNPLMNAIKHHSTLMSYSVLSMVSDLNKAYLQHTKEFAEVLAAYSLDKIAYPLPQNMMQPNEAVAHERGYQEGYKKGYAAGKVETLASLGADEFGEVKGNKETRTVAYNDGYQQAMRDFREDTKGKPISAEQVWKEAEERNARQTDEALARRAERLADLTKSDYAPVHDNSYGSGPKEDDAGEMVSETAARVYESNMARDVEEAKAERKSVTRGYSGMGMPKSLGPDDGREPFTTDPGGEIWDDGSAPILPEQHAAKRPKR